MDGPLGTAQDFSTLPTSSRKSQCRRVAACCCTTNSRRAPASGAAWELPKGSGVAEALRRLR